MTQRTTVGELRVIVRAALREERISQAEAARQLGLSTKHMSQMLTGRSPLSLDWAERLLGLCGKRLAVRAMADSTDALCCDLQVWPLVRVLAEVRCGSQDWSWEEEWASLDRRHAQTNYLATLEQQIRENGITLPILIGSDGRLWDGHHRLRIAVRLGIEYIPVEVTPTIGECPKEPA